MRILAIRGCNLASLAGEFEIDLAGGPLGAAGVFAIVGNTGAGKSTLLDALCVALFDRTPRLTNHSRVVVGRGEEDPGSLGAQDVRTLLRRGAVHGWAEVDFESGDARRYRARWSVRRARGQAHGTIQPQQVSLIALDDGERLGGTKTETLAAIHARLGLSFEQFRRSALLAQGEFAAFLRAEGKDRSELLERMTGTEIYSRVSVLAHQRAAVAGLRMVEGRAAVDAIVVLDGQARASAEAEVVAAEAARTAARGQLTAAETAARWRAEAATRADALRVATQASALATARLADTDAARAELVLRNRAEALRPVWDEAARLDRQVAIGRGEVVGARADAAQAEQQRAEIVSRRAALASLHAPVRAARLAAGLVERSVAADGAELRARAAHDDAAWLSARPALAAELSGWNDLDARFAQHAALGDAIAAHDRTLAAHAATATAVSGDHAGVVVEHRAAVARLANAQRQVESFHKRRGVSIDAARKLEDEAREAMADADTRTRIVSDAQAAHAAHAAIEAQLASLAGLDLVEAAQVRELDASMVTARIVRGERTRVVDELRRAAGYAHARAELRDGEACPLCGAEAHPWADRGALDEVIAAAEASLATLEGELAAATTRHATLVGGAQLRVAERARLAVQATAVAAARVAATVTWRDHLTAAGELILVDDPASPAAAALATEGAAAAHKRLEAARDVRRQTDAAMKAVAEAQAEVQACQAIVDALAVRLAELERKRAELAATTKRIEGERAGRVERRVELAAELTTAVQRWRDAVPAEPLGSSGGDPTSAVVRAWLAELVTAWRTRAERIVDADGGLVAALLEVDRRSVEVERAASECSARLASGEARLAALGGELATAVVRLDAAIATSGFDREELRRLLVADPSRVEVLVEQLATAEREADSARTLVVERQRLVDDHATTRPPAVDDVRALEALERVVVDAEARAARAVAVVLADDEAHGRRVVAVEALAAAEAEAGVDAILGEVIGSHDGKKFRSFAQSLTLDGLLAVANAHLDELAPRYQLERVPLHDLELQVIDRDLGDEVRSVQSLSGGESFLVSLALALGLSSMSAHDVRVRTLLIDEGFGTLDPSTLDGALAVLDALQAHGRQVGVISHVPQLVERVGAHVRVVQRGGGRSEVIVA